MAALPGNWRSRQWCHSCPPGCCGPTARHDRAESVRKIMELLRLVVLLWIATPALAKWNSTFPCACKLGMMLGVHDILARGLSRLGGHRSRDDEDGELSDDAQLGARGGGSGRCRHSGHVGSTARRDQTCARARMFARAVHTLVDMIYGIARGRETLAEASSSTSSLVGD